MNGQEAMAVTYARTTSLGDGEVAPSKAPDCLRADHAGAWAFLLRSLGLPLLASPHGSSQQLLEASDPSPPSPPHHLGACV